MGVGPVWHGVGMCRSIVTLRSPEVVADETSDLKALIPKVAAAPHA